MLVDIEKIEITDRIRHDFGNIEELANDIRENGLINPPVVTPEYRLIAGERRLRAMKLLEWKQVVVNIMTVRDYEHQLRLEISENENRKEFTFTERVAWAKRLEQVEKLKAEERTKDPLQNFAEGQIGNSRDKVAKVAGFGSGENYRKAKFIAENADRDTLEAWDKGDISTHAAHKRTKELEAKLKQVEQERDVAKKASQDFQAKWMKEKSKPPVIEEKVVEAVPATIQTRLHQLETELKAAAVERKKAKDALEAAKEAAKQYHQNWLRDKENGGAIHISKNPTELLERVNKALSELTVHERTKDLVLPSKTIVRHQMILDVLELAQLLTGR